MDILLPNTEIDDMLRKDIVGARRRIIFTEGDASSLDQPLYALIFPDISVRPQGSSRDVERVIDGLRSSTQLHWVKAWGIIDNDGRSPAEIGRLRSIGIFAIPFYSIESLYYHAEIVRLVALRNAQVLGGDGEQRARDAIDGAIACAQPHFERLTARSVEKSVRHQVLCGMPSLESIKEKKPVRIEFDTGPIFDQQLESLTGAAENRDWNYIVTKCPIRETPARDAIAKAVGFQNRLQYEGAVLKLLRDHPEALQFVRSLFDELCAEVEIR